MLKSNSAEVTKEAWFEESKQAGCNQGCILEVQMASVPVNEWTQVRLVDLFDHRQQKRKRAWVLELYIEYHSDRIETLNVNKVRVEGHESGQKSDELHLHNFKSSQRMQVDTSLNVTLHLFVFFAVDHQSAQAAGRIAI
jgi:hypothetical protein